MRTGTSTCKTSLRAAMSIAAIVALVGCSAPPPRLFVLDGATAPSAVEAGFVTSDQSSKPYQVAAAPPVIKAGVMVAIPQYLDRPEIVVRTDQYELKPLNDSRWAEDLSITASRAIASDLGALMPGSDFISLPTRVERSIDYRIGVDVTKFDTDTAGNLELTGRWSIIDVTTGNEHAAGRFQETAKANASDAASIAAAMSEMLSRLSSDIVTAWHQARFASRP